MRDGGRALAKLVRQLAGRGAGGGVITRQRTLMAAFAAEVAAALPGSLQGTATAEALRGMVDLDRETLAAIEPPRGYGRH